MIELTKNYDNLANQGMSAEKLASEFINDYFKNSTISFPINPFQILKELNVLFTLRPFKNYDGIYIPAENSDDIPVVGINLNRPITRQRYSAAHELCHFLKDSHKQFACIPNSRNLIEQYAEKFASELLMPIKELKKQAIKYSKNGYVDLDSVLRISDYFGVSFQSCLFSLAYKLHMIEGDVNPDRLKKLAKKFKPDNERKKLNLSNTVLYEQLIDAMGSIMNFKPTEYALQKFKAEYIYHDSRMEGINIDQETASQIVIDLRINKQESEYCKEENQNIIEVAGLTFAYDYAFEECKELITVYDAKHINEKLFCTAPFPEYGGMYRQTNTLVLGSKFETIDFHEISLEMKNLDNEIKEFMDESNELSISEYIKCVANIHHRLTVIHAFRDGNGRTSRVFANMMLLRRNIYPIFFSGQQKDEYKEALKDADLKGAFENLYECFYKSILNSFSTLSDFTF